MSTILQGRPIRQNSAEAHASDQTTPYGGSETISRTFYDDMTVFAESRALHGEGERGAGVGLQIIIDHDQDRKRSSISADKDTDLLEGLVVLLIVGHRGG